MALENNTKDHQVESTSIPMKLMQFFKVLLETNSKFRRSHPELNLREYTLRDIQLASDNHRLAAYGRIDQLLESGSITPEEAQRQKDQWDTLHSYK